MKIIWYILFSIIVFQSCKPPEKNNSFEINLDSGWMFRKLPDKIWYPAKIPGTLLQNLFINKQIDDPRVRDNLNTVSWIEKEDWEYKTEFDVPDEILLQDSIYLNFGGLFPFAGILLNDSLIYSATGYYNTFTIACKKQLKQKQNKLCIQFYSPFNPSRFNEKEQQEFFSQSKAFIPSTLFNGTRVSPKLFNFGVLQPIKLIAWSDTRIKNFYFTTDSINPNTAFISAIIEIESIRDNKLELVLDINKGSTKLSNSLSVKKGTQTRKIEIQIDKPDLWWCNGKGRQSLYQAKISLLKEGFVVSKKSVSFGIRKIELITQPDSANYVFYFKLNNKPVFIKGANLIPSKIYQLDDDVEFYERLTDNAVDANINMFRMWGGAIYESPEFYELCNKKGILIWQDFVFTATEKKFDAEFNKNTLFSQVNLLQNNPCLALCFVNADYPKKDKYTVKTINSSITNLMNGLKKFSTPIFIDTLKTIKTEHSGYYSGTDWTMWYEGSPLDNIQNKNFPFTYEFGIQALPDMKTTGNFTDKDDYDLRSPILAVHQFDQPLPNTYGLSGSQLLANYVQMYFNQPDRFESFVYLSQIYQAQGLKYTIETYRTKQPATMGAIFWHFNDAWPSISWSVMDNYNRFKPSYYAIREAYKNIIIVPERFKKQVRIWAINDSSVDLNTEIHASLMDFYGNIQYEFSDTIQIDTNKPYLAFSEPERKLVSATHSNKLLLYTTLLSGNKIIADNTLYFCDPSFLDLPVPDIQLKIDIKANGYLMTVTSENLVKNLVFTTVNNECTFSDNNLDILPGATKYIFAEYTGSKQEFEEDLQMKSLIDSF